MSPETPPVVEEEERLLKTVRDNILRLRGGPARADHQATLLSLRDSLEGEKLVDDIASIVEAMDRTAALMRQQDATPEGVVDADNPYFGHMVLEDDFGKRSILIGRTTFLSDRVRIVDWRNAPISRIFYQYGEGDDYDEEVNGTAVSGEVLLRRTMTIHGGALRRVSTDDNTWVRDGDAGWIDVRDREAALGGGAGSAVRPDNLGTSAGNGRRDKHLPEIASLLDPEQFALITRPDAGVVVIQGSAGSGKTTVGLHRIAYLNFHDPNRFRPKRMLVMAFSRALSAYISKVLPALGVEGVEVDEYPRWAQWLRRLHFGKRVPDAYSDETPALVSRFKMHTALLRMIDDLGRTRRGDDPVRVFEEQLTDHAWIGEGLARYAPHAFSVSEVEKIYRWCTKQYYLRVDGGGPNDHEIPTLDPEDDTLLLRLHQVLRGPLEVQRGRPLRYDHLMVDEAQDLSPIELAVLVGTTGKRRSVTIAGDTAQQVMDHREFTGWRDVLDALDLGHIEVSPLQVSYRSTRQIMQVARDILGPLAPDEPLAAPRDGVPVAHLRFDDMGAAATWLAPALTDLMAREPTANVALLTADLGAARDWYAVFERAEVPHVALVDDQDFSFAPGIEVTDVRSSKGLEFDYVVLLGVDARSYPVLDASRHLLHVGATRAAHQLWIVSTGLPSPLIPEGLPGVD
ncbi:MAG: DNA helicase UvrD [Deltaproteobacteria bacterium HGW-Deltaproteobacteria-14]|jgi:DNA helicase-2/ATP-dependent DNA helicase PcrA|nr:MAG: DNA helicase UvrD [Deltaproteobacteria bacterium HGW-Deltaproteobacteria-14]